jgi:hypothetical protein
VPGIDHRIHELEDGALIGGRQLFGFDFAAAIALFALVLFGVVPIAVHAIDPGEDLCDGGVELGGDLRPHLAILEHQPGQGLVFDERNLMLLGNFADALRVEAGALRLQSLAHLAELRQDIGYALRTLIKSPGLALAGIVSLGLGIGVSTTAFSELRALIFKEMPAAQDPKSLVAIESPVSYPYFEHFRDQRQLFAGATAYMAMVPFSVALEGAVNAKSERIFGHLVSTEYFQVLGVNPARGRLLSPEDDKPDGPPVAVVSDRFWRTRLEADPRAVGRTVKINGQTVTVVGVGPKDFLGVWPIMPADIFVPLTVRERLAPGA